MRDPCRNSIVSLKFDTMVRNMISPSIRLILISALILGVGLAVGWYAHSSQGSLRDTEVRENNPKYSFINPLLACEIAEGRLNVEIPSAKGQVTSIVNKAIAKGDIVHGAVYFRDLNNGWWFGINEKEQYRPASLLKLPLMMSYYRLAETHPQILKATIAYTKPAEEINKYAIAIPPEQSLIVGKNYTVSELIDHMIWYSDNQAGGLLGLHASREQIQETFINLHLQDPLSSENEGLISVKDYASFFRVLFNASYLNKEYSELALSKLAQVKYADGLVAGIPKDVTIAHKFGEGQDTEGNIELHDCGIIYSGKKPYVLCVMTKGQELGKMQNVIQEISRAVYKQVESAIKN